MASSSPPEASARLAALDRLAGVVLAAAAPLRVDVARTPAEVRAAQRLRYEHVVAAGWAEAAQLAGAVERDVHDTRAVHVLAWDGALLAGTLRLVLPAPGRRLPVEEEFAIDVEPRGAVVEVGRLLVAPARRGDAAHRIWGALFGRAWREVRARGLHVMAGAASASLVALYRSQGLAFEILGPARRHWGEERHPVRLDPTAAPQPHWFDVDPKEATP